MLDPVNISPLQAGIMFSFVGEGTEEQCRKNGPLPLGLVFCFCLPVAAKTEHAELAAQAPASVVDCPCLDSWLLAPPGGLAGFGPDSLCPTLVRWYAKGEAYSLPAPPVFPCLPQLAQCNPVNLFTM